MSRTNSERLASLETGNQILIQTVTEVRNALLGENGLSTRVTRTEERVDTMSPRMDRVESRAESTEAKIEKLTLKVASFCGLASFVMVIMGEWVKSWF
jgi:uncharacterized membrane protein